MNSILNIFIKHVHSFFKIKSVHPKLGSGAIGTILLIIAFIVQLVTGLPLIKDHMFFVFIVASIPAVLVYKKFDSEYDPKNNDNIKVFLFLMLIIVLFGIFVLLKDGKKS